jgi:hypothetical protein
MGDDTERLRTILTRFAQKPHDSELWPQARELADKFTLDQLCAMAPDRAAEVKRLFDRILGRTMRLAERLAERRDVRRASGIGTNTPEPDSGVEWVAVRGRGAAGGSR